MMTILSAATCATDLDDDSLNHALLADGWTIRHIETWHRNGHHDSIIVWDAPDLPF